MDSVRSFLLHNLLLCFPYPCFHYFTCFHLLSNLGAEKRKHLRRTLPQTFEKLSPNESGGARCYLQSKGQSLSADWTPQNEHMLQNREGKAVEHGSRQKRLTGKRGKGKEKGDQFWTLWIREDSRRTIEIGHPPHCVPGSVPGARNTVASGTDTGTLRSVRPELRRMAWNR